MSAYKRERSKGSKLVYTCPDCEKSMLNDKDTIQKHRNKFCKVKK